VRFAVQKQDIIIAGVGGQGILTIAALIGGAAIRRGLHIKQSEVHGMAQRGGAVLTHLRLSSDPIASDLIPHGQADVLLAMEPMEGLRYLPFARRESVLVANRNPVKNVPAYPDLEKILARVREWPKNLVLDAEKLAREAGNVRAVNSVMLGAASGFLLIPPDVLRGCVGDFFARKGQAVVDQNLKAFDSGVAAAG
jgi:indolepyruvate ferredoxin oxidoreductase, beta subunit